MILCGRSFDFCQTAAIHSDLVCRCQSSQEADGLHYATVSFNQRDGSGPQRENNTVNECVYSSVRP